MFAIKVVNKTVIN